MGDTAKLIRELRCLRAERDRALELAQWSAVENNSIVNEVWALLGGPDATREGGQNLVLRVKESLSALRAEVERLTRERDDLLAGCAYEGLPCRRLLNMAAAHTKASKEARAAEAEADRLTKALALAILATT